METAKIWRGNGIRRICYGNYQNITLLMGGYGSQTMSIDGYGRPVFTALVKTPEPATGVLSLLGLGLLACRRRRK